MQLYFVISIRCDASSMPISVLLVEGDMLGYGVAFNIFIEEFSECTEVHPALRKDDSQRITLK